MNAKNPATVAAAKKIREDSTYMYETLVERLLQYEAQSGFDSFTQLSTAMMLLVWAVYRHNKKTPDCPLSVGDVLALMEGKLSDPPVPVADIR